GTLDLGITYGGGEVTDAAVERAMGIEESYITSLQSDLYDGCCEQSKLVVDDPSMMLAFIKGAVGEMNSKTLNDYSTEFRKAQINLEKQRKGQA
ncbi:MAG: hypothetical protein L6R37_008375, partial [Teloschistes peruensis]